VISLKLVGQMTSTRSLLFVLLSAVAWSTSASAQTLTTLASFNGSNGNEPVYRYNPKLKYIDLTRDRLRQTKTDGAVVYLAASSHSEYTKHRNEDPNQR
jgi:hypothetical protein